METIRRGTLKLTMEVAYTETPNVDEEILYHIKKALEGLVDTRLLIANVRSEIWESPHGQG